MDLERRVMNLEKQAVGTPEDAELRSRLYRAFEAVCDELGLDEALTREISDVFTYHTDMERVAFAWKPEWSYRHESRCVCHFGPGFDLGDILRYHFHPEMYRPGTGRYDKRRAVMAAVVSRVCRQAGMELYRCRKWVTGTPNYTDYAASIIEGLKRSLENHAARSCEPAE